MKEILLGHDRKTDAFKTHFHLSGGTGKGKPTPEFSNVRDLAEWFNSQRADIESLAVDDRVKRTLLASLNERNADLMAQLVGNMEPGKRRCSAKHLHGSCTVIALKP